MFNASTLRSSIGLKMQMAVSGAALLLFVIAHMLGNLQVFLGPDRFNHYAETLQAMPALIWPARFGLLVLFVMHITAGAALWRKNRAARPEEYKQEERVQASVASLYMMETGIVILIFVILHLVHFTFGALQTEHFNLVDAENRHDVYAMVTRGFENTTYSLIYIVAMLFLGVHLSHAISSMCQTLGWSTPHRQRRWRAVAHFLGYLIALGYIVIPAAVLLGMLTPTSGGLQL